MARPRLRGAGHGLSTAWQEQWENVPAVLLLADHYNEQTHVLYRSLTLLALSTAAGTARATCHRERFGEFPVTVDNRRPLVTTQVNATDESFILSNGEFFSLLSKHVATAL